MILRHRESEPISVKHVDLCSPSHRSLTINRMARKDPPLLPARGSWPPAISDRGPSTVVDPSSTILDEAPFRYKNSPSSHHGDYQHWNQRIWPYRSVRTSLSNALFDICSDGPSRFASALDSEGHCSPVPITHIFLVMSLSVCLAASLCERLPTSPTSTLSPSTILSSPSNSKSKPHPTQRSAVGRPISPLTSIRFSPPSDATQHGVHVQVRYGPRQVRCRSHA
jgi:hypothetical protein